MPSAAEEDAGIAGRALEAVQRVADATLAYLSEDDLLRELLLRITEIQHPVTAAILVMDDAGT